MSGQIACVSSGPQPLRGIPVENRELTHIYIYIHLEKAARTKANGGKNEADGSDDGRSKDIYILCARLRSYAIDEIRITEEGKEKFN